MSDWFDLEDTYEQFVDKPVRVARDKIAHDFMTKVTTPTNNANWEEGKMPVLSGRLMANTILSIKTPANYSTVQTDTEGTDTYLRAMSALYQSDTYDNVYIQNALDYAVQADSQGWAQTAAYKFWNNATVYAESNMGESQ